MPVSVVSAVRDGGEAAEGRADRRAGRRNQVHIAKVDVGEADRAPVG